MSFTGTPTFKMVSDRLVRITGLALTTGVQGVLGLHGATGDSLPQFTLPEAFKTEHYTVDGSPVPFQDAINCQANVTINASGGLPPTVNKSGSNVGDFRLTIQNNGSSTVNLEILVSYH